MDMRLRQRKGTSLLEILVVIVLLLVGILAVFKLFPVGLQTLKNSGDTTLAQRIASGELERLKKQAYTLPDGIYAITYTGTPGNLTLIANPDVIPDDLGVDQDAVDNLGVDPLYVSDANKIRRVVGEKLPLDAPRFDAATNQMTCFNMLSFGPYVPSSEGLFVVYGNPLSQVEVDTIDGAPMARYMRHYAFGVDFEAEKLLLASYPGRTITYRVAFVYVAQESGKYIQKYVVDKLVTVDPMTGGNVWNEIQFKDLLASADQSAFQYPVRGSVSVSIAYNNVTGNNYSTDWAYEYKSDPNRPWMVMINPLAYDMSYPTSGGRWQPKVVNVSYDVLDWHILRNDVQVPIDGSVKLNISNILGIGTEMYNYKTYSGLATFPPFSGRDIIVIDKLSGTILDPADNTQLDENGAAILPPLYTVDYKYGRLLFKPQLAKKAYRVLYKADGDMAVQVQKPNNTYVPVSSGPLTVGQCMIGDGNNNSDASRIYFPNCDVGKQIILRDYNFSYETTAGRINGRQSATTFIIKPADDGVGLPYIDLNDMLKGMPNCAADPDGSFNWVNGYAVRNIMGASVRVRVIWKNSNKHWNKFDLDSILMRSDSSR